MPRTTRASAARNGSVGMSSGPRSVRLNEKYASSADPMYPSAPLAASTAYPWCVLPSTVLSNSPATPSPSV